MPPDPFHLRLTVRELVRRYGTQAVADELQSASASCIRCWKCKGWDTVPEASLLPGWSVFICKACKRRTTVRAAVQNPA